MQIDIRVLETCTPLFISFKIGNLTNVQNLWILKQDLDEESRQTILS